MICFGVAKSNKDYTVIISYEIAFMLRLYLFLIVYAVKFSSKPVTAIVIFADTRDVFFFF